jgi:polyferredoxin
MQKVFQIIFQIIFLALFVFWVITEKIQLWMAIFALGLILSIFLSRLYCGWACPINTLTGSVAWLKRKLKIKNIRIPTFIKKTEIRYIVLGLFVAIFAFSMLSGKKLAVFPALLIIGVALTLFFPEELWHRYLCPYGTLFHMIARKPLLGMRIDQTACTNCGACVRVCPAAAIDKKAENLMIKEDACLVCFDCSTKCRQNAISYQTTHKIISESI